MQNLECPHCQKETITPKQRLQTGLWLNAICKACSGRMCAQPIVMAIVYFFHMWNVIFFGFMAIYEKSLGYFITMIIFWALLTWGAYYIPLSRMRPTNVQK